MNVMRWALGLFFIIAGIAHFVRPDVYLKIMPPYLPWHRGLVFLSGVAEVVLGALVLVPRCTVPAAWGLIALLVAVFPANLYMAQNPGLFPKLSPTLLWLRLPLQAVLIGWAYWVARGGG
ncbi:MAG TPA: MauE/DoxX family redox-associated membrane protein [Thermoanaerobaculia bacterium]|nr:MauE/DoxX family redox-associated membrane protein [Thermoanaerobaculia bacterium]